MKTVLIVLIPILLLGCNKKSSPVKPESVPQAEVSPTILDFGRIKAYSGTSKRGFTVKNTGEVPFDGTLAVVDENTSGSFFIPEANRNYTLHPGESLTVVVTFRTKGLGRINGTVETGNSCCEDVYCWGIGY